MTVDEDGLDEARAILRAGAPRAARRLVRLATAKGYTKADEVGEPEEVAYRVARRVNAHVRLAKVQTMAAVAVLDRAARLGAVTPDDLASMPRQVRIEALRDALRQELEAQGKVDDEAQRDLAAEELLARVDAGTTKGR